MDAPKAATPTWERKDTIPTATSATANSVTTNTNTNAELVKAVQAIMNDVFRILRGYFDASTNYEASTILSNVRETIVKG